MTSEKEDGQQVSSTTADDMTDDQLVIDFSTNAANVQTSCENYEQFQSTVAPDQSMDSDEVVDPVSDSEMQEIPHTDVQETFQQPPNGKNSYTAIQRDDPVYSEDSVPDSVVVGLTGAGIQSPVAEIPDSPPLLFSYNYNPAGNRTIFSPQYPIPPVANAPESPPMCETQNEENKSYSEKNEIMTEEISEKDSTNVAQEKSPESPTEDSTATSCDPPSPGTAALQKESPKSVESMNSPKTTINEKPTPANEELEEFSEEEKDYEELENKKCSLLKKLEEVDPEDMEDGEIADEEDEAEEQPKKPKKVKKKKDKEKAKEKEKEKSKEKEKEKKKEKEKEKKKEKEKEKKKKRRHSEEDKEKSSSKKKRRSREDEVEEDFVFVGGASPAKVFETEINPDINNFRFQDDEKFGDDSRRRRRSPPHRPSGGGGGRGGGGRKRKEPQVGPPPSRRSRRPANEKKKNDVICTYFMQGKCKMSRKDCPFSHDAVPLRKMELCKFWMMECCAKKEKCLYLHNDFPCKYYHTGLVCKMGDRCKFSHQPLSEVTKSVLLKHIESAPAEILGDFPRLNRYRALNLINKMESKINGTLEHERIKAEREREDHSGRRARWEQPTRDDHEKLHEEAGIYGYYKDTLEDGPDDYQPQHSNNNNHGPHGGPHGGGPYGSPPHHGGGDHGVTHGGPHRRPRNQMSPQRPPMNQMNSPMNQQGPPPMNQMNQNQVPLNQMNSQGPMNPGQLPQLNLPALNLPNQMLPMGLMGSYSPEIIQQLRQLVNDPALANVLATLNIQSTTILKTEKDPKEPKEHLPKMQRELVLRIQQQQMKNEQKEEDISDDEKGTCWYSSDEESDRKKENPDFSSVLSAIRQSVQPAPEEPKPKTSPPRGDVDLRYNNSNLFGDTNFRLPPLRPAEFNDVDLRDRPNNNQSVFKSVPAVAATQIRTGYDSHAPLTYKLALIRGLGKPDYSHIRSTMALGMIFTDPRLGPRKDAFGELPPPASPPPSLSNINLPVPNIPADILVDPRSRARNTFGDPRSTQQPATPLWPPGSQDINPVLAAQFMQAAAFGTFSTDFSSLRPQQTQQQQQQRFPSAPASSWERYNQQQSSGNLTPPI